MRAVKKHMTYANVMVTVLAFIVLGGTAWAAKKIGSKQLKSNAVTTKKIADGAVSAAKLSGVTVQKVVAPSVPAAGVGGATATCPTGQQAVSGGGLSDSTTDGAFIEDSRPVNNNTDLPDSGQSFTGWRVVWKNTAAAAVTPTVWVACIN